MDKRILKTRKNIKKTLTLLLAKNSFEQITVTEICKVGEIGRITFYTHYDDKYALLEDIFHDFLTESTEKYYQLQAENNPGGFALKGYYNLLSSILDLFDTHYDFLQHSTPEKNPYLYSTMYRHFFAALTEYIQRHGSIFPKYPSRITAALICNGLCGVLSECQQSNYSFAKSKEMALSMYQDMLRSPLFQEPK